MAGAALVPRAHVNSSLPLGEHALIVYKVVHRLDGDPSDRGMGRIDNDVTFQRQHSGRDDKAKMAEGVEPFGAVLHACMIRGKSRPARRQSAGIGLQV